MLQTSELTHTHARAHWLSTHFAALCGLGSCRKSTDVNHGGWGMHPPKKFTVGRMAILPFPQYGWLTGQRSAPPPNTIKSRLTVSPSDKSLLTALVPVLHPFPKISVGVRPLDPLLGIRPWIPRGEFRPPGYLLLCVSPPAPKVTEPLTPLRKSHPGFLAECYKREDKTRIGFFRYFSEPYNVVPFIFVTDRKVIGRQDRRKLFMVEC